MRAKVLAVVAVMGFGATGCAVMTGDGDTAGVAPTLTQFSSTAQFSAYLEGVDRSNPHRFGPQPVPLADASATDTVVVSGAKVQSESITNNQVVGVEEGDVVKRVGDHLVILQDGRLFSVALRSGGAVSLSFRDRIDVYTMPETDTWYDEMLVYGDRVVVTGYSYEAEATEISVLSLDDDGRFSRLGRFYLSSDDYYDTENYATRMIGDRLVVHTPIYLSDLYTEGEIAFPAVIPARGPDQRASMVDSRPLFGATDIYRPVREPQFPVLHAISACDMETFGQDAAAMPGTCRTTAFVASAEYEVFVSGPDLYVWSWDGRFEDGCEEGRPSLRDAVKASVHRVSLDDGSLAVLGAAGTPADQFGMASDEVSFRGFVRWHREGCLFDSETDRFALMNVPHTRFGDTLMPAREGAFAKVPDLSGVGRLRTRFTEDFLVYLGGDELGWPPREGDGPLSSSVVVVPLDDVTSPVIVPVPHSAIRLERAGPEDAIVTGYTDHEGLRVSYLDLSSAPRLTDTAFLEGHYESEGRSHAFNSRIDRSGGLMGLPTVPRGEDASRSYATSSASALSFLSVDETGALSVLGNIAASGDQDGSYACEVSCIDWYGNSRPIFTDDRVFALSVTEVIEAEVIKGRVTPVRRVDLTSPDPRR